MKNTKSAVPEAKPQAVEPSAPAKEAGTERWPKSCVVDGAWFKLPKVLLRRFGKLGIEPQHLLLLLVLQTDRFRNRPHRFYWEDLATLCGCSRNTVRRWGYELKKKGFLNITPVPGRLPGEGHTVGYRNARSIFDLKPFEKKLEQLQAAWDEEHGEKKKPKRKRAAA